MKKKMIKIIVRGGVIQHIADVPKGVCVRVRDYDVTDPKEDDDSYPGYEEEIWE